MFAARVLPLVVTLWVGSLWTVGYIVAPTLFATLADSTAAGSIAGRLFRIEAWLTVVCSVLLIVLLRMKSGGAEPSRRRQLQWIVMGMLACTLLGYFALHPFMEALREATAAAGGVWEPQARQRFGMLHGISSVFYLLQSLLGAVLVVRLR